MAAAATEIGERPGTISSSTALRAICDAARCTIVGNPENKVFVCKTGHCVS